MPEKQFGERPRIVPPPRGITIKEIVEDIRRGMTDSQMMEKYKVSAKGLASAFKKLLAAQVITPFEFSQWATLFSKTPYLDNIRLFPRRDLNFHLPISEVGDPSVRGRVVNISDSGVAVSGMKVSEGEAKTLMIPIKPAPLIFEAVCRWVRSSEEPDKCLAGFETKKVDQESWESLGRLIQRAIQKQRERLQVPERPAEPERTAAGEKPVTPSSPRADEKPQETRGETAKAEPTKAESRAAEQIVREPPCAEAIAEELTLELIESYVDSDKYVKLFTNGRKYLAFIMNPASFAKLSPETRNEMLEKVRQKNTFMLGDLRMKAKAFQLAIEHSALLANP